MVVAECIETPDELAAVIDAGCHLGQGYVLARPALPPPPMVWPLA
jgi:EAL domain-containing protein (putative c-di-GMP-specific phosphodiesterase class I)